jgi:hypothetical protein
MTCPTLVTLDSPEIQNNTAFQGVAEARVEVAVRNRYLHVEIVAGADHFYTSQRQEIGEQIEAWLRRLLVKPSGD